MKLTLKCIQRCNICLCSLNRVVKNVQLNNLYITLVQPGITDHRYLSCVYLLIYICKLVSTKLRSCGSKYNI